MTNYAEAGAGLQDFMHAHVPLAKAGGITVSHYDGQSLSMTAPLALNINDKGTAFGGSLQNLSVMLCWGMTFLKAKEMNLPGDIVVASSDMQFLRPLKEDLVATVRSPAEDVLEQFSAYFKEKGRASIKYEVEVLNAAGEVCATCKAKFALLS